MALRYDAAANTLCFPELLMLFLHAEERVEARFYAAQNRAV
jgi:hypothetical protein